MLNFFLLRHLQPFWSMYRTLIYKIDHANFWPPPPGRSQKNSGLNVCFFWHRLYSLIQHSWFNTFPLEGNPGFPRFPDIFCVMSSISLQQSGTRPIEAVSSLNFPWFLNGAVYILGTFSFRGCMTQKIEEIIPICSHLTYLTSFWTIHWGDSPSPEAEPVPRLFFDCFLLNPVPFLLNKLVKK